MQRRAFVTVVGAVISGGCAGDSSGSATTSSPNKDGIDVGEADAVVTMTNEPAFDPDTVEIEAGQTVVWKNESTRMQTVTAYEDSIPEGADYFASGGYSREVLATIIYPFGGDVRPGERFAHTFETPGEYEYYSIPTEHRGMKGTVVVQ